MLTFQPRFSPAFSLSLVMQTIRDGRPLSALRGREHRLHNLLDSVSMGEIGVRLSALDDRLHEGSRLQDLSFVIGRAQSWNWPKQLPARLRRPAHDDAIALDIVSIGRRIVLKFVAALPSKGERAFAAADLEGKIVLVSPGEAAGFQGAEGPVGEANERDRDIVDVDRDHFVGARESFGARAAL